MSSDNTILLTGASGFLGAVLLPGLSDAYKVCGVANSRPGKGLRVCDLTDGQLVEDMLNDVDPDIIIHAAAMTDVDACERSPASAFVSNVKITKLLADWTRAKKPATRFVYISTDQVYDGTGPHAEDAVWPGNVYALTKLWAEDYVANLSHGVVLRTNFFGQNAVDTKDLISMLHNKVVNGGAVTLFRDVWFSPLHVDFLADVIVDVLRLKIRGVFNAGASGPGMTKAEFARTFTRQMGLSSASFKDGSVDDVDLTAHRPRDMRLDSMKLQSALGRQLPSVMDGIFRLSDCWCDPRDQGEA